DFYGDLTVEFDGQQVDASLGDADDPGMRYKNGEIERINFGVTADFDVEGLTVSPDDLTFKYSSSNDYFEMYGDISITFDGEELDASFGDSDDPGLVYENGSISHVDIGITADFEIESLSVSPQDLTFVYDSSEDYYEMYGDISITFDGQEIDALLGDESDPGLVYESGSVTHVNIGITADFEIEGLSVSPQDLTFVYDSSEDYYEMYGALTVSLDGEEIDALLGDESDPGLVYENGTITHVNFGITADFEIKSLAIIPEDLTFEYDYSEDYYEMYGDITFKIGDDELEAIMGDADDPGLVYENGSITHINIGITSDFSLAGLKIKTTDLGAEWNSGSDYHIYGDANLSIENETVDVDFGTFDDPGIVVKNGVLHSFEVDVNSDLTLGNLEVETVDLDIAYSDEVFEVSGEMKITEIFSLAVILGDDDEAGLEIDVSGSEPRFKVEALEIDIEHANLGTIDLKKFDLKFNSNGIEESDVKVVFPSGTEIDAVLKFTGDPVTIDEISIAYEATNLAEALELFSGVQIAELSGTVGNLSNPSYLYVLADITTIYGGGFTLSGHSATFVEMYDAVSIYPDEFTMSGDVNVGAYKSGDNWKSLLGEGSFDLDVIFHDYSYVKVLGIGNQKIVSKTASVLVTLDVKIPSDPLVEASATVYGNSNKDFDALIDLTFYVPHSLPFIGGKKLGSTDGAVRYKNDDLNDSYAAAWSSVHTFWKTYHLGAKYKFGSRKVSTFTKSSTISDIKDDIEDDINSKALSTARPFTTSYHTFEVYEDPVAPGMLLIQANWENVIDSVLVTAVGPEGVYELTRTIALTDTNTTTVPEFGYEENMGWVTNDSSAVFILTSPSAMSEEELAHSLLLDGRYQIIVSMPSDQAPDSVQLTVDGIYQVPSIELEVTEDGAGYELEAGYWSILPDSSHISFYVNFFDSMEEAILISHVEVENFDEYGYGAEQLAYRPDVLASADTLYFFAVIDDGVNPPQVTDSGIPVFYTPNLYGTVSFPEGADSLKTGLRVFVDADQDSSFDVTSTGGLELFSITGPDGQYSIHGLEPGTYHIRIVLPEGYRISGTENHRSEYVITYEEDPIELNFEIEAYTEENQ
ncbi:MAG: hypothetical protein MI700_07035, partial [Balneolales bacterium]|nr:hypothetical protein [Balneolales bacterium]